MVLCVEYTEMCNMPHLVCSITGHLPHKSLLKPPVESVHRVCINKMQITLHLDAAMVILELAMSSTAIRRQANMLTYVNSSSARQQPLNSLHSSPMSVVRCLPDLL